MLLVQPRRALVMHHSASSTTYPVRPLPDRVDSLENRNYRIEKAGIFLHAVLWGTAPISRRTGELLLEMFSPTMATMKDAGRSPSFSP